MITLYIAISFLVGGVIAWFICKDIIQKKLKLLLDASEKQKNTINSDLQTANALLIDVKEQLINTKEKAEGLQNTNNEISQAKVKAETELEQLKNQLEAEKLLLEEAKEKLKDAFKALAGDTLTENNSAFLEMAKAYFDAKLESAKGEISQKEKAVKDLIDPISLSLEKFNEEITKIENSRISAYSKLTAQVESLATTEQSLKNETGNLIHALRTPKRIGTWGQIALKRVVELAGLSAHIDFNEEVSVTTDDGRLRPDMIVHLPNNRDIVVDAKATFDAFYEAISAEDEDTRNKALEKHAQKIRDHMNKLSAKNYWNQFEKAPEFVVMFIPGESFFSAAAEIDQTLLDEAMEKRVIISTPTTLVALLRAIAYGWSQEQITQNALKISKLGKDVYERLSILADHLIGIGSGIQKTSQAYNKAVGSLEGNLLPAARKFKDMGISSSKEIQELEINDVELRSLSAPEITINASDDDQTTIDELTHH